MCVHVWLCMHVHAHWLWVGVNLPDIYMYMDCFTSFTCFRDVFCAGRVTDEDMKRTMKACGGSVQTSVEDLSAAVLGTCEVFEEKQVGSER